MKPEYYLVYGVETKEGSSYSDEPDPWILDRQLFETEAEAEAEAAKHKGFYVDSRVVTFRVKSHREEK